MGLCALIVHSLLLPTLFYFMTIRPFANPFPCLSTLRFFSVGLVTCKASKRLHIQALIWSIVDFLWSKYLGIERLHHMAGI